MNYFIKYALLLMIIIGNISVIAEENVMEKMDDSVLLKVKPSDFNITVPDAINVKVLPNITVDKPISKILGGYLFEMGYGDMETSMWAEMFFNRKFDDFLPYMPNRDWWYHLRQDPIYESSLKTDWTKMIWYHSGYEHSSWYIAPAKKPSLNVDTNSTFYITTSDEINANLQLNKNDDSQYITIVNNEKTKKAALAQDGKFFRKGIAYTFTGYLKSVSGNKKVEICFYPEGNWSKPIFSIPVNNLTSEFEKYTVTWNNTNFDGRATFALMVFPESVIAADTFSLTPSDSVYGWRADVVKAAKDILPGAIRWPGGCFAAWYDWRDGIGPLDERKYKPSYHWGGTVSNDVGTIEYLQYCQLTGAEPFIGVNMFHPNKEIYKYYGDGKINQLHGFKFPHLTDVNKGAKLAADWVAYCNAPVSHPMGALRAKHGHPVPFKVKYWELDNELFRWFDDAEELARYSVVYSKAMKAIDPDIKIGICTYGNPLSPNVDKMLEISGEYIDFLADRGPFTSNIAGKIKLLKDYNKKHGTDIRYADTEFFVNIDAYTGKRLDEFTKLKDDRNIRFATWGYALASINDLMMWQRFGGDVIFSCFNSYANDHLNSVIDTPKEGVLTRFTGMVYKFMASSPAAWILETKGYIPDESKPFQIQAALNEDRTQLILYVFNATPETRTASFDLNGLELNLNHAGIRQISANDTLAMRCVKQPSQLNEQNYSDILNISFTYSFDAIPFSFTEIVLSENHNTRKNTYLNPVGGSMIMGDPFAYYHKGMYYLIGTSFEHEHSNFIIYQSKDMSNWEVSGFAIDKVSDKLGKSHYWAPEVEYYNNKFYLTYSAMDKELGWLVTNLAVSDNPQGPFTVIQSPWFDIGQNAIDADIFIDDDGRVYLTFSRNGEKDGYGYGEIMGVELKKDLSGFIGEPKLLMKASQPWERINWKENRCNEGSFVFKHNDKYYMTYSANHTYMPGYGIGYAYSDSPLGPWIKYENNPIAGTDLKVGYSGAGHSSIVSSPDGKEMFIVYHTHQDPSDPYNAKRYVNVDRLYFDNDGILKVSGPTRTPQPLPSGSY